jgi:hypothetical protein
MKIIEKEFDVLTGKETITERNETPQEKLERQEFEAKIKAEELELETKAKTRAVILERLGITAEEAALLLG